MIVFKAHPGEQPVLDGTGNDSSPEGFQATSHMVLDGLTFRNYSESIDLRGSGLKDIVIVNCTIKDAKDYGIYGWNGDRLRVENVVMESLGDRGYYGGGTNVHFHGVKISHVNGRGISISGSHFDNINILNSEISATDCGILANARNMLIMNCTIRDNKRVGVWALGKNVRVANCIISGTTLHRGSAANISIGRGASIEILNSVLARSERFGLYIHDDAKHCRLVNSIIYDNKDLEIRGIRLPSLEENHNLFYDPREELAPRGQASRVVDPQFIRVGEDDFHLQKSSPAIDGGVTLKLIKTDIDGNARPQGKRFDIGAHEHMPAIKGLNE
jgi:hypothetical protein